MLGARLKTVNLSSFLSQCRENNTLYVENSVDVGTKEVYQLSTYIHKYKKRTSTQVLCRRTTSYYQPNRRTRAGTITILRKQ
jgi:hypothetical protein